MHWRDVPTSAYTVPMLFALFSFGLIVVLPAQLGGTDDVHLRSLLVLTALGVMVWPLVVMTIHGYHQDRILDRIRAQYVLATCHLMGGQEALARARLKKIRRLELLWRFGASYPYRLALLSYVITVEFVWAIAYLVLSIHLDPHQSSKHLNDTINKFWTDPIHQAFLIAFAVFYSVAWVRDAVDIQSRSWSEFYGDRLAAALKAGRGVEMAPQHEGPELPLNVSARELFGLGPYFTKAELRRAWIRLARELHPDGWMASGEGVRRMKEAALKRVNAARDELREVAA